jgi:asparagine synthase (glutamine-hydrolysing)
MKYLFFEYVPSPHTILSDAKKLPPASYLIWQKGGVKIKEYWSPFGSENKEKNLPEPEVESRMIELLRQSVKRRLISDVPLGVFLSGGIDSSAIAAFAQREVPGKIKTFSIGFEDSSFDESEICTSGVGISRNRSPRADDDPS